MYYSQFQEDRILARIFGGTYTGTCVEIGANDGIHGSTTYFFEKKGWKCILVEPNPTLAARLRSFRTGQVFECAASSETGMAVLQLAEGDGLAHAVSTIESGDEAANTLRKHGATVRPVQVTTKRLDEILEESGVDEIDFMSIDVEGHELEVLKGLSIARWQPGIMILEDNSRFRDNRVRDYLRDHGYVRFRRSGVNDWYARTDDVRYSGRGRKLRYLGSALGASAYLGWFNLKVRIAAVPGILPLVHWLRRRVG